MLSKIDVANLGIVDEARPPETELLRHEPRPDQCEVAEGERADEARPHADRTPLALGRSHRAGDQQHADENGAVDAHEHRSAGGQSEHESPHHAVSAPPNGHGRDEHEGQRGDEERL